MCMLNSNDVQGYMGRVLFVKLSNFRSTVY